MDRAAEYSLIGSRRSALESFPPHGDRRPGFRPSHHRRSVSRVERRIWRRAPHYRSRLWSLSRSSLDKSIGLTADGALETPCGTTVPVWEGRTPLRACVIDSTTRRRPGRAPNSTPSSGSSNSDLQRFPGDHDQFVGESSIRNKLLQLPTGTRERQTVTEGGSTSMNADKTSSARLRIATL